MEFLFGVMFKWGGKDLNMSIQQGFKGIMRGENSIVLIEEGFKRELIDEMA